MMRPVSVLHLHLTAWLSRLITSISGRVSDSFPWFVSPSALLFPEERIVAHQTQAQFLCEAQIVMAVIPNMSSGKCTLVESLHMVTFAFKCPGGGEECVHICKHDTELSTLFFFLTHLLWRRTLHYWGGLFITEEDSLLLRKTLLLRKIPQAL